VYRSKNERYQVIRSDNEVIQFKNEQSWTFKLIPKTATINALVTLSLDPETVDSEFMQIKYHKDQYFCPYPLNILSYTLLTVVGQMTRTTATRGLVLASRSSRPTKWLNT
jgi:hypothetical protein